MGREHGFIKRRPRVDLRRPAVLIDEDGNEFDVTVLDVSSRGFRLEVADSPRIAEFMTGENMTIQAHGFSSPFLRKMGETEIVDELRVIISENQRTTAYFTFSSQMRPSLHQFRIYGSKNGLILDQDQETVIKLPGAKLKSYAEPFFTPMLFAKQQLANSYHNIRTFLANDFHMKAGMKHLIESFYHSVVDGTPAPIPYREIILTARIMDIIFAQLDEQRGASVHADMAVRTRD